MKRVLLDTGMLVGLMREAPWALKADAELDLSGPETLAFTSAVCRGELMALAEKRGWGAGKREQMESVLDRFPTIGINQPSILSAYALIDAWTRGASVQAPTNAPPPRPALPMSKNDLWVAATAHAGQAVLVSTDTDFDRLDGVWLKFVFVAQTRLP